MRIASMTRCLVHPKAKFANNCIKQEKEKEKFQFQCQSIDFIRSAVFI